MIKFIIVFAIVMYIIVWSITVIVDFVNGPESDKNNIKYPIYNMPNDAKIISYTILFEDKNGYHRVEFDDKGTVVSFDTMNIDL